MQKSNIKKQFFRYLMVGGLSFVLDFLVLFVLKEFVGVNYLIAATLSFILGLLTNYTLSIYWVFDQRAINNQFNEFFIFSSIGVIGVALNVLIMYFLTDFLLFFYLYSKIVATIFVFLFNFFSRKILLFSVG